MTPEWSDEFKAEIALVAVLAEGYQGFQRWTCEDYGFQESDLFDPAAKLNSWRRCGKDIPLAEHAGTACPMYTRDRGAFADVLVEIGRRNWQQRYIEALARELGYRDAGIFNLNAYTFTWAMMTATLEQQCRAAVSILEG